MSDQDTRFPAGSDHNSPSTASRPDGEPSPSREKDLFTEEAMATLFEHVGPRLDAPRELKNSVFEIVEQTWQENTERRAVRRRRTIWAAAAGLICSIGLAWWALGTWNPSSTRPIATETVATVEALFGESPALAPGQILTAGTEIITDGHQRVALRLDDHLSLRLQEDTRLRLLSRHSVELLGGTVYFDSGASDAARAATPSDSPSSNSRIPTQLAEIEIHTRFGTASDIGTQFETRVDADSLRIQVREGAVLVAVGDESHRAEAGVELTVDSAGHVAKARLPQQQDWSWILATAPIFQLDGSTLGQALDWVARETGWTVRFEDEDLEAEARRIVTRGSLDGLTPDQAPELIVPTAGLSYSLDGQTLTIMRSSTPAPN